MTFRYKKMSALAAVMLASVATPAMACLDVGLVDNATTTWPPSTWEYNSQTYCIRGGTGALEARTFQVGADIDYSANITLESSGAASQGGLVFRSKGSYTNGYLALLHKASGVSRVELYKDGLPLGTTANRTINFNQAYRLRVTTAGNTIKVYFNNETTPAIEVIDATYASGYMGLFRAGTAASFKTITHTATQVASLHTSEIGYQTYAEKTCARTGSVRKHD